MNFQEFTFGGFIKKFEPIRTKFNSIIFTDLNEISRIVKETIHVENIFSLVKYGEHFFILPGTINNNLVGLIITRKRYSLTDSIFIEVDDKRINRELEKDIN